MICSKCGKQCADSEKTCPACGNELDDSATDFIDNDQEMTTPAYTDVKQMDETKFTLWNSDETDIAQSQETEIQPIARPVETQNTNYGDKPAGFVTNFGVQQEVAADPMLPSRPVHKVSQQAQKAQKPRKKVNKGKIVAAVIAVLLIATAVVAAIFLLKEGKKDDSVQSKLNLGNKYLSSYNYEKAVLAFENALEIDPDNYNAHCGCARALRGSERYDKAEDEYREAIKLDPKTPIAYRELAELYIQVDNKDDAYDLIDTAVNDEGINDEDILEVHRKMNPQKPEVSIPSGSYDTRREVILSDPDDGIIYYTTDGTTPTSNSNVYDEPLVLENGDTDIKAITISDYGFESDVAEADYYISIPDMVVVFQDATVERAVRDILGKYYGDEVYNDEVAAITELSIVGDRYGSQMSATFVEGQYSVNSNYYNNYFGSVQTLADLSMMPFLKTLNLAYQENVNISALTGCKSLQNLSLINIGLTNVDAISGLTGLKKLCVAWNYISDISKLSGLTSLTHLGIWRNSISDVSVVSNMPELVYLDFADNSVSNISAVSSLSNLTELWVYGNRISDFSPIVGLHSLKVLMLNNNPVSSMEPIIKAYPRLTKIDVAIIKSGGDE